MLKNFVARKKQIWAEATMHKQLSGQTLSVGRDVLSGWLPGFEDGFERRAPKADLLSVTAQYRQGYIAGEYRRSLGSIILEAQ